MTLFVSLGLFAGANSVWAEDPNPETDYFWARLIAKPATTTAGSGTVFVTDESSDEGAIYKADTSRMDGYSPIYLMSSILNSEVSFYIFAKPDAGSYFTGWSYIDGHTDLGSDAPISVMPSSQKGHSNAREHIVYAAFKPIQLVSYEIVSGSNTTSQVGEEWTCTQTIRFRAETPDGSGLGNTTDVRHFKLPVIERKEGTTGTWTTSVMEWAAPSNINFYGSYAELIVPVTFTVSNGNPGEYAATLTLETYAGVKIKVYLYARTTGGSEQAIRYNKSKVKQESGDLSDLLAHATTGDIIKLNANYSNAVELNDTITFDLNGFTLSNTLTVSDGNVTLAYSPYGGSVNALEVTGGKAILNGGTLGSLTIGANGAVEQNGAEITDTATNNGSLTTTNGEFQAGLTSSNTLIVNGGSFAGTTAINVTGGTAQIKRGTITGSSYGIQSAGTTTIEKLAVITGGTKALKRTAGSLTVNNGKFANHTNLAEGDIVFNAAYFQNNTGDSTIFRGKQVWRNTAGAEAREGYAFFIGSQDAAQASNVSVCRIGQASYSSLEDALAYANNSGEEVLIIMENDYVLKAGYYTLPANATLIVPMSNDQEVANPIVPRETSGTPSPVSFRKLTFADGVNMNVLGTIELSCTQHGSGETMGIPGGNYGHLILKPGSHITLSSGAELRAWGYVTGDGTRDADGTYLSGEIDARRGSIVREMFQMGDWKGGNISLTMVMPMPPYSDYMDKTHLFPIYTYFIQNVESPVKYHPGSSLICATSVNVSGSINAYANDIKIVGKTGEPAMFLMSEMADADNTWVRKWYDAQHDKQVYEVNSGAQLGSVVIDLGEVPGSMFGASGMFKIQLDSRKFVLPLTNNFKIHLLSGEMAFTQSTSCLPGMEVEVDKESEVSIIKNDDPSIVSGALYLYDADQWSYNNDQEHGYVGNSGKFGAIVRYSATWDLAPDRATTRPNVRDISSPAAIGDAILNVHGTFRMGANCAVYTTWAKDDTRLALNENGTGGASIISTNEDAGTYIFGADAPDFSGITLDGEGSFETIGPNCLVNYDHNNYGISAYPIHQETVLPGDEVGYGWELCTSAKLKNGEGAEHPFATTEGTKKDTSFCYINNQWTLMKVDEDDECFMVDNYGTFYAKPAEYVALNATKEGDVITGNDDHTFSDKDGAGRLFICMLDCQWWEVEKKDNLYHCIHPDNDTYYYWDEDGEEWLEKTFTITWKNWDGTIIQTADEYGDPADNYVVTYGTMAEFFGSNPTRPANIDYTYDFTGWSPALGKVTSDVTYTATYKEQPRKYTIIFQQEGGAEIERHFLTHNEVPVCENVPTRTGFTLQWNPALKAVTGDTTYVATWLEEPPTEYAITFVDYNDSVLQQEMVAVDSLPMYEGDIPSAKPATSEFTYVFDHWSPNVTKVTQAMTYTAVYREVPKTYTIIFNNEDNSERERHEYAYGETPVCLDMPTKANTAQYTYSFAWVPQIETVRGATTYTAQFTPTTNKYSVTLQSNLAGACTFAGAGIYDYNESTTAVTVTLVANTGYTFEGWSDDSSNKNTTRQMAVTSDVLLVANFSVENPDYTVTWKNEDGSIILKEVGQKANTATTYTGLTPTKSTADGYTYTFDGWTTEPNGAGTYYRTGMTPKATTDVTYYAHFLATAIPNLEVSNSVTVLTDPVEYHNLIITSNGITSGQLVGSDNLTLTGNAYFDFAVNAKARTWYSVAVPWQVDAETGISVNGQTKRLGKDFDIIYYDGERRAAEGPKRTWNYVEAGDKKMHPGTLYMILFYSDAPIIRFAKEEGQPMLTTTTAVAVHSSAIATDANWNGVANPALFHAYVNTGATLGQVYNPNTDSYNTIVLSDSKLVVGQGVFVQAPSSKAITVSYGGAYAAAPRRRAKAAMENTSYEVRIAPINKAYTDRIFAQIDEQKIPDEYTIGKDLVKMGVSSSIAQMWINRYNTKLCLNTMATEGDKVEYPLGVFASETGEYMIGICYPADASQAELYLTLDGQAIWNLSKSAYTLELEKGTTNRYGLRVRSKAPQIATDIDELIVDSKGATATKVLMNNQVFIIRGDEVFTITGNKVK